MLKCIHCSKELFSKTSKKFCNRSCSASYNNRLKVKHGNYAEKPCLVCGTITTAKKYCSKKCAGIAKTIYKTAEEKLAAKRLLGRESFARYSARKKYQTPIDEDLQAIKEFYKNCPAGYEVDHIIPISKGGPHSISNLQYLLAADNRKKSAKLHWCPEGDLNA